MPNNPKAENNLIPFKPGQSGNPKGRPRKMVSQVLKDLGDAGIENVTKQQVVGCIEILLNCTEDDLEAYKSDKAHSVLIRMVARHLLNSGEDEKIMDMLLNRAFGKPDGKTDITSDGDKINIPLIHWVESEDQD